MGKDGRLYAKFTLDFADNHKILPLSDAAFRCLVEATLWSREHLTDGWLASRLALAKWSLDVLQELSTNDPDAPSLIALETGWLIRDFAEHQDTREEIEARRERNRLAGQKGGLAKSKRGAKRGAKPTASESLSETVAETETRGKSVFEVSHVAPHDRCPRHINSEVVPPCGACADARRAHEAWTADELNRKRAEREARDAVAAACPLCDGLWVLDSDPVVKCRHETVEVG